MKPIRLISLLFFCMGFFAIPTQAAVDLELSLNLDNTELVASEYRVLTVTLTNAGDETATNISTELDFPYANFFTTFYSVTNASQGSFSNLNSMWNVGALAAGETASLTIQFQPTSDVERFNIFAQVATTLETDADSTPNNNTTGEAVEDDEAAIFLTNDEIENGGGNGGGNGDDNDGDGDGDGNNGGGGTGGANDGLPGPPTVFLRAPVNPVTGDFKVEIYFSEPVEGLEIADFVLSNCTILDLYGDIAATGQFYSLDVRPTAATPITIQLAENTVTDLDEGNNNTVSNLLEIDFDFANNYVDLALDLEADKANVALFETVRIAVTITNTGTIPATDVVIDFGYGAQDADNPFAYVTQNVPASQYDAWNGLWYLEYIGPGEVKTMDLILFARSEASVSLFAQVWDAQQYDNDSVLANDTDQTVDEDDEASTMITIGTMEAGMDIDPFAGQAAGLTNPTAVSLNAYPNPAIDYVMIAYAAAKSSNTTIAVYNSNGQLVQNNAWSLYKGNNENRIEVANLPTGLYIVTLTDAKGALLGQSRFLK